MTAMQASVLRAVHDLALEQRPVPRPGPRDVLVQVTAVGVCGSDVHYFEQGASAITWSVNRSSSAECSGHPEATARAVSVLAPAGRAVLVGMGADMLALPLTDIQDRELDITGVFRYANTWPTAVELVAAGRVVLDSLVTGHYPLAAVRDALTANLTDPGTVKVVVTPSA